MGIEILYLLLPLAAFSGWLIGRRDPTRHKRQGKPRFSTEYFKGLNFLLNEQPDKAIDVFIHMLEADSDTVDTHFAIGNLFRRRGEVERAIRIHQNLIARPTLTRQQRDQALYELGFDYMRAGLLDRAETLFQELLKDSPDYRVQALQQLLDIYQQEKEWGKAIATGQRLQVLDNQSLSPVIAHFYCEQAEHALMLGEHVETVQLLQRALSEDRSCVRASLLEARLRLRDDENKAALRILRRVEQQNPAYLSEALPLLEEAFGNMDKPAALLEYLQELFSRHGGITLMLKLADLIRQHKGDEAAVGFVTEHLLEHPSIPGMERLVSLQLHNDTTGNSRQLQVLGKLLARLLEKKPAYLCNQCGYTSKALSWQCPGCRQWNTIKPIQTFDSD